MNCFKCGKYLSDTVRFCDGCGADQAMAPQKAAAQPQAPAVEVLPAKKEKDGFAITGFILGMCGIATSLSDANLIIFILAIVFSAIGLARIKKNNKSGKGFAIAGLVAGIVGLVFVLLVVLVIGCMCASMFSAMDPNLYYF